MQNLLSIADELTAAGGGWLMMHQGSKVFSDIEADGFVDQIVEAE